ncbi:hypothetical protein Y032_0107g3804 [Ancylostoma ceylanicum]|uniref:Helix-turn-helix domain-containing protein n=1 Tax=Ancylostoma ceylanicum TaxID=53326 RepID=A0A016TFK0_9BILA|nr:hypothetical protein Y032_0107g3804 [Ancylostoma ceylanicum]
MTCSSSVLPLPTCTRWLRTSIRATRTTVESPDDSGSLPYLNTKVQICNGTKQFLWYKKPISKNIMLHSRSAHPLFMKANVIRNLIITKEKTCSRVSPEVEENIRQILEENGYTTSKPSSWRPSFVTGGIPLVLPYVNEHIARDVNRVVRASMLLIRLIFRPPPNLKSLLTSSRMYEDKYGRKSSTYCTEKKICQLRGTVYLVTCEGCGQKYIGETLRPRLDEHVRALRNPSSYPNSGFARARTLCHTHTRTSASDPSYCITPLSGGPARKETDRGLGDKATVPPK